LTIELAEWLFLVRWKFFCQHNERGSLTAIENAAGPYLDDRERRARARQAAEALFAPETPVTEKPIHQWRNSRKYYQPRRRRRSAMR
jgi:hypothetical protein